MPPPRTGKPKPSAPPAALRRCACTWAPIDRDQARRMLADGAEPCPYCSPDTALGMTT
ncbi:DUF6233 domain-containing protein [Streptomyces sp. NPDC091259]|uniref:DUF6233 domain-containing protein n=1 Tax=Streptomyces sp. NPDC091259 TaxID=3365976 RepID=UPI0037F16A15